LSASRPQRGRFPESRAHWSRMPDAAAVPGDDLRTAGARGPAAGRVPAGGGVEMTRSLEGATVLVTGGAGLIGSHIIDRLIDAGAGEIRVLDDLSRGRVANLASAQARR